MAVCVYRLSLGAILCRRGRAKVTEGGQPPIMLAVWIASISAAQVDARALAIEQLLPQRNGLTVAAMQEVIGGEQHQGAHFPRILLEGAIEQAGCLGSKLLTRLVVEHGGLRGLGRRAGPPSCRARR